MRIETEIRPSEPRSCPGVRGQIATRRFKAAFTPTHGKRPDDRLAAGGPVTASLPGAPVTASLPGAPHEIGRAHV